MKAKLLKRGFLMILVLFLTCLFGSATAFQPDDTDQGLTNIEDVPVAVVQTIQGDSSNGKGIFTYKITAVTQGAPMPSNGSALTLTGNSGDYFRFDLSGCQAGDIFEYEIRQEKSSEENYYWDQSVYRVSLQLIRNQESGLEANAVISNGSTKTPVAGFSNVYHVTDQPVEPVVSNPPNTDTGIRGSKGILALFGLLILAVSVSVITSYCKHHFCVRDSHRSDYF